MTSDRRLGENIASLAVLQGLNYAVPLLTLPYLVRVRQPFHFGLLSFAEAIVLSFDVRTDFGSNLSATRSIAASRHDFDAISRVFSATIYAKLFLMCISAIVHTVLVLSTTRLRETPLLCAVNFLCVTGTVFFSIWLFQGLERIKLAAEILNAARLLATPALFLFVPRPQNYVIAGAIQASVEVAASMGIWLRPSPLCSTFAQNSGVAVAEE